MANKPTPRDIVAYRDQEDVARTLRRAIRTDPEGLLALADARLLALALRLNEPSASAKEHVTDGELIRYLQSDLSNADVALLERRLSGDATALARLLALRQALGDVTSVRVNLPAREMTRHDLGIVTWRQRGSILEFAHPSIPPQISQVSADIFAAPDYPIAALREDVGLFRDHDREPQEIGELESQLQRLLDLLQSYRNLLDRTKDQTTNENGEEELRRLRQHLEIEFLSVAEELREHGPKGAKSLSRSTWSPQIARRLDLLRRTPQRSMTPTFVAELPLATASTLMALTGSEAKIQIRALTREREPWPDGLITIVEEGRGFESIDFDSESAASLNIGEWSEPTLLIETDETIELRLRRAPTEK